MGNSASAENRCLPCQFLLPRRPCQAHKQGGSALSSQEEDALFRAILQVQPDAFEEGCGVKVGRSPCSAPTRVASKQHQSLSSSQDASAPFTPDSKPTGKTTGTRRDTPLGRRWLSKIVEALDAGDSDRSRSGSSTSSTPFQDSVACETPGEKATDQRTCEYITPRSLSGIDTPAASTGPKCATSNSQFVSQVCSSGTNDSVFASCRHTAPHRRPDLLNPILTYAPLARRHGLATVPSPARRRIPKST